MLSKLPEDKKIYLSYICSKNGILESIVESENENSNIKKSSNGEVNRINLDDLENNNENKKKLSVVQSTECDNIDRKLDNYLLDIYTKKRISQIPFRRTSAGNYDYGSQKVMVKIEGEVIRGKINIFIIYFIVRVGGGYMILDKFIETYAPIEEANMMKVENVSDKYKNNTGIKKVINQEGNIYEFSSTGKNMAVTINTKNDKNTSHSPINYNKKFK
jgi:hypothetical protein